jgi:polyhydroxyalkanoate depolymerase
MLYEAYDWWAATAGLARTTAGAWESVLRAAAQVVPEPPLLRTWRAVLEVASTTAVTHERPTFAIEPVARGGVVLPVREQVERRWAFCDLRSFTAGAPGGRPKVLVVAPMAGHFATLLRPTVQSLVADHDVYLTDWRNARDVPVAEGAFGFEDYVDVVLDALAHVGPGVHVLAVCQPCVAALAATAIAADGSVPAPASLTLMAGPVDARVNPTAVDAVATAHPLSWFERTVVTSVPWRFAGRGRRVYPGVLQLAGFLSLDPQRHLRSQLERVRSTAEGDDAKAAAVARFYDEYLTVMDLPAEFYLETIRLVFQEFALARGVLRHHGRLVDPGAIVATPLLTIEGERDDIAAPGQTMAAHALCTGLAPEHHQHLLQPGVGHYGVFSGRGWRNAIYPRLRAFVAACDERHLAVA